MSKKWIKIFFSGGDRIPSVEWVSGSLREVKQLAYEQMAETAYLDLEDEGICDIKGAFLKELRIREKDNCLFLKFKHGCHPRSDMAVMSKAALEKTIPMLTVKGRKVWAFAWVDDNASSEACEFVVRIAKGSKKAVKEIMAAKVNRPASFRHETKYSVEEMYHPNGFAGFSDDVMDHISYGEGLRVVAVPFSEIPEHTKGETRW